MGIVMMPIGIVDHTASRHTIAYCLVGQADAETHEFALNVIKQAVE